MKHHHQDLHAPTYEEKCQGIIKENIRALSFTSGTGAEHHVKACIQNCLNREKRQFADCHF